MKNTIGCDLAAELVEVFGRVRLRVSGMSMAPALYPGELVSVEKASIVEVVQGQIVVFAREGRLIAHRVTTKVRNNGAFCLVTRGDRSWKSDAPVSSSEFVGLVTHVDRGRSRTAVASRRSLPLQAISRLLSFSDRGTHLYLRLAWRWREFLSGRTAWQG